MLKIFTYAEQSLSLRDIFFLRILGQRLNVFSECSAYAKNWNFRNSRYLIKLSGARAGAEAVIRICGSVEPEPEPKKYFRLHITVA
jgi:hypothetical protein